MKILIAEDEAIIAESLYQVLSELGYSPLEPCINSEDAIIH
jgi:DNA-binding response OmpR family regulator